MSFLSRRSPSHLIIGVVTLVYLPSFAYMYSRYHWTEHTPSIQEGERGDAEISRYHTLHLGFKLYPK
ncbi:hypothetical protein L873DRAFT_1070677 [Choiromyces venosus 120613-1]|uniref:Uncharacterized protein n=1 Tax=Choiromyces venosus 120613-1 TaxID=1336337 RepID=A0A3N4K352_9PEZI|nr:hypothetical protein L873DRAFT_1070677 [Choiromyces venosus 120613-1]